MSVPKVLPVFSILLAAVSALVWGSADYCGGRASQRANALTVTVVSQLLGLPVLALGLLLLPGNLALADVAWGMGAGAAGLLGIVLLYRSLSTGAMAIAAPTTAVMGALLPVLVGLITEDVPSPVALVGVGCAIVAIALVSLGHGASGRVSPRVLGLALAAGTMFGLFFVLLAQAGPGTGMWPLIPVRATSLGLGLVLLLAARRRGTSMHLPRRLLGWATLAGMGDLSANAIYLVAAHDGLLAVVAPIAALYPVSTVLLALAVDKERVGPVQVAGLGLAAAALVLTAV